MKMEKLLGKNITPALEELLALLLSEQMTNLGREAEREEPEKYQELNERFDRWEQEVKETAPELREKNREFLDWIVGWYGAEQESYYLIGLRDGIRLFRWMMEQ